MTINEAKRIVKQAGYKIEDHAEVSKVKDAFFQAVQDKSGPNPLIGATDKLCALGFTYFKASTLVDSWTEEAMKQGLM